MIRIETGNIVTGNYPIFCQQVNCRKVMGAGLAKQIRNEYPEVYTQYKHNAPVLGNILPVVTSDGRICINMYAQDGFGRDRKYTDYQAFGNCLQNIVSFIASHHDYIHTPIAFPYGIGCGLAGGDWNIIYGMLYNFSQKIEADTIIVKRGE